MTPRIGNLLPSSSLHKDADKAIAPKSVIRLEVQDISKKKFKRFVILGTSEDNNLIAALYFNTSFNSNVFRTPDLKNSNLFFTAKDRDYLSHDCFLDCAHVYEKDMAILLKAYEDNPSIFLDEVSSEDFQFIKKTVRESRVVSRKIKKKYGLYT